MSSKLVAAQDKELTDEVLGDIYFHGVLRKSIDWMFQNEWRLVLPRKYEKTDDYNVKFFPISKVFLGNRMHYDRRKELINICHEKNIPYIGVKRKASVFEMEDCELECEDCPKYTDTKI